MKLHSIQIPSSCTTKRNAGRAPANRSGDRGQDAQRLQPTLGVDVPADNRRTEKAEHRPVGIAERASVLSSRPSRDRLRIAVIVA